MAIRIETYTILFFLVVLPGLFLTQTRDIGKHMVSVSSGVNYEGVFLSGTKVKVVISENEYEVQFRASPVGIASYHFKPSQKWSFSSLVSYDYLKVDYRDNAGSGRLQMNKFNTSIGAYYYFLSKNSWNVYSGARIGLTYWQFSYKDNLGALYNILKLRGFERGFLPSAQLVPIGLQKLINKKLGLFSELGIGVPYAMIFGVQYHFMDSSNEHPK